MREKPREISREIALTVRFPEPLYRRLQKRAKFNEQTVAGLIRFMVKHYLRTHPTPEDDG